MEFVDRYNEMAEEVADNAIKKGFSVDNDGEKIALMHSELSEALESLRRGDPPSDHIPDFKGSEEEFADLIIRVMDYGYRKGLRIAEALMAKTKYNITRPYKHGKKF